MKNLAFAAVYLLCLPVFSEPLQCSTDKTNSKECAEFRERIKKEDARRLATFNAVNTANPASSTSKAKSVKEGVRIGMTMDEARASTWGRPHDINRTTTAYGTREQWIYGGRNYLYFRNGVLESIQN